MSKDETELVRADQINVGDLLDLEGDPYADPHRGGTPGHLNSFEFELAEVTEVERETVDCVRIGGLGFCVGFPVGHMLKRHMQKPKAASVGYRVHEYGYDVIVYDEGGHDIETYNAGNSRWDSQAFVERGDPARLTKTTLRRFAKQTATEMAASYGADPFCVHEERD